LFTKIHQRRGNSSNEFSPLFNPFNIPINKTPLILTKDLGNNNEKEIELSLKSFHAPDKFKNPMLPKPTVYIYESSYHGHSKSPYPKSNSSDKASLAQIINDNSKKFPKAKAPITIKGNLNPTVSQPKMINSKRKISRKRIHLKYNKTGHMVDKRKN